MTTPDQRANAELFRQAPHRYIDVGEGQVAYRKVGSGPDVLFVHGWPVSGATFRHVLPHLEPHVTCHVIDMVGAGDSRFDRTTRIDLEQHVTSVRRVIDALGLTDYAVVGHDSGGMLARHATVGDPRLRAVALVNSEQPQGLSRLFRLFIAMSKLPAFASILAWAANRPALRRSRFLLGECFADRSLLDGDFAELFLAPLRDDANRRWAAGELIGHFHRRFIDELDGIHRRLGVPVQLVWGADDPFFPLAWTREMAERYPLTNLHVVAGTKLFCHEEKPAEVAGALLPALTASRSAASARAAAV